MERLVRMAVGLGQIALVAALVAMPIGLGFYAREEGETENAPRHPEPGSIAITCLATMMSDFDTGYQGSAVLPDGQRIVVHADQLFPRELNGRRVLVAYSNLDDCWELLSTNPERRPSRWHSPVWQGPHDRPGAQAQRPVSVGGFRPYQQRASEHAHPMRPVTRRESRLRDL